MRPGTGTFVLLLLLIVQAACHSAARSSALPTALNDEEFWRMSEGFSEAPGDFPHSDNLVSNETQFVHLVRMLRHGGGVYIGVGPEQNFSYIARLRPAMAFIVDIRRENHSLHLMYKALFELSADRADLVSRLFSRQRPPDVGLNTSVDDLFAQYEIVRPDERLYEANARRIRERLLDAHRFPLSSDALDAVDYAFKAFYSDGPDIHYGRSRPSDSPGPSYRTLMTAADVRGQPRSYLATEEGFAFVKDLHQRNMIVPIIGDFAGPAALRRVGDYLRTHEEIIDAFYGSNVEVYLNRAEIRAFCGNLATLPYGSRTWFIDNKDMQPFRSKLKSCPR